MKKIFAIGGLLLLAGAVIVSCQSKPDKAQLADQRLEEIVQRLDATGLSVAVVKDGRVVYLKALGNRTLDPAAPLDTNSMFRIASISKTFTSTALNQLSEQGKFGLDDDISDAMGFPVRNPKYPDRPITYRMLLSHSSSLNDNEGYWQKNALDLLNPEKNPNYANAFNDYEPGTKYEYCNLAFNTLGALVERHSGVRFDQYVKENILDKLGMRSGFYVKGYPDTLFTALYEKNKDGRWVEQLSVADYVPSDSLLAPENYKMGYSTPVFSPTGGMKTSPKELAKFMMAHMNGGEYNGVRILKPETVREMHTPVLTDSLGDGAGLDFFTEHRLIPGEVMVGHTGSAYGLYSAMYFERDGKFGIIMMTNGCKPEYVADHFTRIQYEVVNALYDTFIKEK